MDVRGEDARPINQPFSRRVYEVVARIPVGRVTSYGRIARSLGDPRAARMVGWALRAVPDDLDLPCHRVVNREGMLSGGWNFGHPDVMRELLVREGVPFQDDYQVAIDRCLWNPENADLPATDGVNDLQPIARLENRGGVIPPSQHDTVTLDDRHSIGEAALD